MPPFRRKPESLCAKAQTIRLAANEIPAFAGMAVFFVFADIPNLAVSENIKNTIPAKAGISLFTLIFRINPPPHSCEGRNLYAEGGNCTITRRYAAAEIPAFAGMGQRGREWDSLFTYIPRLL
ncbi:MAG: hypothetical protein ACR2QC_01645 [Gammaproteobacteria bacterium]